jgi:hypothetical protein
MSAMRQQNDRARGDDRRLIDVAAEEAEAMAERGRELAEDVASDARLSLKGLGYASVGVGDAGVDGVRALARMSRRLPGHLREAPEAVGTWAKQLGTEFQRGYAHLSERGRRVTGAARRDPRVHEARRRTEAAGSQAKAAATTATDKGAAAASQAKGAATAVRRRGAEAEPQVKAAGTATRKRGQEAGSAAKGAATSAGRAADAQKEAAGAVAEKLGEADTGSGPLEERTVEQLRNRATELEIEGRSTMKKQELVKAIRDAQ